MREILSRPTSKRPSRRRLEVFSWSLGNDSHSHVDHGEDAGKFPAGDFKDIIFIVDESRLHEIYDPQKDNKYLDLPPQNQEHSSNDNICKRKRKEEEDFVSGHTDLALTGPDQGMMVCNTFDVVVHKDDPADHGYIQRATDAYLGWRLVPVDKSMTCLARDSAFYDNPRVVQVDLDSGPLKLDYIVISDSKLVTVFVEWLVESSGGGDGKENHDTTDIHVCGNVAVSSEKHSDYESVLLQTPKNKSVKLNQGNHIPLSRSLVAVPYKSAFTVEANLLNPINGSYVQGEVTFPFKEMPSYEDTQYISDGIGAKIRVKVNVER